MRPLALFSTIAISLGLVAAAQASDWSRSQDRYSYRTERRADRDYRHFDRRDSQRVTCTAQSGERMSAGDLRAKLTSAGYQVLTLKPKRNGCVEVKVSQADGWSNELVVDPVTAEIKYRKH